MSIEPNPVIGEPQYCMVDLSLPLPQPQPIHHNLYHQIDVLPHDISNTSHKRNLFKKLATDASFFYWISIRTAICVPAKCSLNDINSLANVGMIWVLCTNIIILIYLIYLYFFFLFSRRWIGFGEKVSSMSAQ